MYLERIRAKNFRIFGDGETAPSLDWALRPGLNVLIGENDAGKSAVIDAIRQVLWTTSYEAIRLFEQDFHIVGTNRADDLIIEATLTGLSVDQQAAVLEWLTYEEHGKCLLVIHLHARRLPPRENRRGRVETTIRSGFNGSGPEIGSTVRELIRSTYLRPLRDAEAELRPGRFSRLSQILSAHKKIDGQEVNDFVVTTPPTIPEKLVGLMAFAQHYIGEHEVIKNVESDINSNYLSKFSFAHDTLKSKIRIASDHTLTPILEKFELALLPSNHIDPSERCSRGLGYNNALFMATELVLLRDGDELGLLLIEEPEAHIHPQLQDRIMRLLDDYTSSQQEGNRAVQVIMSTHSPSLAAGASIESMSLVVRGQIYPLAPEHTKLLPTDYSYLRRFIDATKANLFFARGVAIVEGPSEALLLPAIAEACNKSFSEYGVSVVNVGDVGLYHYARILQRAKETEKLPIPVACITDRDVVPNLASDYVPKVDGRKRFESDYDAQQLEALIKRKVDRAAGGNIIVCVSDHWTFEYDLARYGCAKLMFIAIQLAIVAKKKDERLNAEDEKSALEAAEAAWCLLEKEELDSEELAAKIYRPLYEKNASKAVAAQYAVSLISTGKYGSDTELFERLPPYLKRALNHLTTAY